MSNSRTAVPPPREADGDRVPGEERMVMLRAMADSITGRGRVVGPAGTFVRVDFDDLRSRLLTG
jgi:hypothetical protein